MGKTLSAPVNLGDANSAEAQIARECELHRLRIENPDATVEDAIASLSAMRNFQIASLLPEDENE